MNDITQILVEIDKGQTKNSDQLLPLVYQELRKLAAAKLSKEKSGQTIQPTMLVHEAYLRLVDVPEPQQWTGRGHFFSAAAEAMRRILIERARHSKTLKEGGNLNQQPLHSDMAAKAGPTLDLLELDEALQKFEEEWPAQAQIVKLKYFVHLTIPEIADATGISTATVERHWRFARAWLKSSLAG